MIATVRACALGLVLSLAAPSLAEAVDETIVLRVGVTSILNLDNSFETVMIGDEYFFQVFDFPFVQGDPRTALKEPRSIVINEELAMRIFGQARSIDSLKETQVLQARIFLGLGHADLFIEIHREARRLLAVAQRGVENDDAAVFQLAEAGMIDGHW